MDLSTYVVKTATGAVDVDASVAQFRTGILAWDAGLSEQLELVRAAMNKVFDVSKNKGKRLNMEFLSAQVCQKLNAPQDQYKTVKENIRSVIATDASFNQTKGPKGGTCRVKDLPKDEPAKAQGQGQTPASDTTAN